MRTHRPLSLLLVFPVLFFAGSFLQKTCGAVKTAEEIAEIASPFVNESTFLVGHADLGAVDIEKLVLRSLDYLNLFMKALDFDEESSQSTLTEARKAIDEKIGLLVEPFENFKKETGLSDIYVVGSLSNPACPVCFLIPGEDKTEEQKAKIREYASEFNEEFVVLESGGFLRFGIPAATDMWEKDDLEESFEQQWADFESGELPFLIEALAAREGNPLRIGLFMPKNASKLLREFVENSGDELPNEFLGLLNFAARKLQWGIYGIDLTQPEAQLIVKAKSSRDAKDMIRTLDGCLEYTVFTMKTGLAMMGNDPDTAPMGELAPLLAELFRGYARSGFPKQDGEFLVWTVNLAPGENRSSLVAAGGISVALLLPAVQAAREAARRMMCSNNEKQIILAFYNYHDVHNTFPPIYTIDEKGNLLHSWRVLILPFADQQGLYDQIRLDEPWDSEYNQQFHDQMPPFYGCPSNVNSPGLCCYSVIMGKEAGFYDEKGRELRDIKDGTSNTICVVERREGVNWMDPLQEITFEEAMEGQEDSDSMMGSFHTSGMNAAFFDGSVRFISSSMDSKILKALFTISGGESDPIP